MYLKNANKGILQGIAVTGPNRTDQNRQRTTIVYYHCGEVVYGCTTPLIHLTTGSGCLSEKFF